MPDRPKMLVSLDVCVVRMRLFALDIILIASEANARSASV
jgi:hypothetical protein